MIKHGIAILGVDHWYGAFHTVRQLRENPVAKLVGATGSSPSKLAAFHDKFGVEIFNDYHEVLKREDVDIVTIFSSIDKTCEYTVAAAEAGKHILMIKPIAMNIEEADRIIRAVEKAGVVADTVEGEFVAAHRDVIEMINKKEIGDVVFVSAAYHTAIAEDWLTSGKPGWFVDPTRVPGGALMDEGIYCMQLLQHIVGKKVKRVLYGKTANLVHKDIKIEDWGLGILEFENGVIGRVEADWTLVKPQITKPSPKLNASCLVQIRGTEGEIVTNWIPYNYRAILGRNYPYWTYIQVPPNDGAELGRGYELGLLGNFIKCVETGKPPLIKLSEARESLRVLKTVYEVEKTKKPIDLN